jgi:hypothetical protein
MQLTVPDLTTMDEIYENLLTFNLRDDIPSIPCPKKWFVPWELVKKKIKELLTSENHCTKHYGEK